MTLVPETRSDAQIIAELAADIRGRDRFYAKKYPFSSKYLTYWDADDFLLKARKEGLQEVVLYNTRFGRPVQIYGKSIKPGAVVIPAYRVIDAQFLPPEALEQLVVAVDIFEGGTLSNLSASGREEMVKYCQAMDQAIIKMVTETGKKNKRMRGLFFVLQKEMGAGDDRVRKRIAYFQELISAYRDDEKTHKDDMKRLGLIK